MFALKKRGNAGGDERSVKNDDLDNQLSRNWYLLAGVSIVSTVGLAIATTPFLKLHVTSLWPWAHTHMVLLGGLTASIIVLVVHLTLQQNRLTGIRNQVNSLGDESSERARRHNARLHALLNVSRIMGSVTNPDNVFNCITKTCIELFDCQQASLMLLNQETQELEMKSATGHIEQGKVTDARQKLGEGIAGWVAEKHQPLILGRDTDPSMYPDLKLRSLNLTAAMVVPIVLRNQLVGVLSISSRTPETQYTEEDLRSLQVFAENAGTCIRHAEQAEWMRNTIDMQREKSGMFDAQPVDTTS